MEITFMPKPRAHSLNFLQKFRGKVKKIDRHSGILGALSGSSQRYASINNQSRVSLAPNNKTIDHQSDIHSRIRNCIDLPIDHNGKQIGETALQLKRTRALWPYCPKRQSSHLLNKQNLATCNGEETQRLLPRLIPKSSVNSKCTKKMKSIIQSGNECRGATNSQASSRIALKQVFLRLSADYN